METVKRVVFKNAGLIVDREPDVPNPFLHWSESDSCKNNIYHPFNNLSDWQLAKWAVQQNPGQNSFTKLLNVDGLQEGLSLSYRNARSLNQIVDEIPGIGGWKRVELKIAAIPEPFILYHRDPLECITALYGNPALSEFMSYVPEKQYADKDRTTRIYNEMNTGSFWWDMQRRLPKGATFLPIISSSDKTQLCAFTGDATAYPYYITIGNISKNIRRKPSHHAQMLVGYLPTSKVESDDMTNSAERIARSRLFHAAASTINEPLERAGRDGIYLAGGDGLVRHCFPIQACYASDTPEQNLVACTRVGPVCDVVQSQLDIYPVKCKRRTQVQSLRRIKLAANQPSLARSENVLKDVGLNFVDEPFWSKLPHCDIHEAIMPDVLHQLFQGLIKHLVAWLVGIVGSAELDARFKCLPKTHGVRHFHNGITGLSNVSGPERKEIIKQLLGLLHGVPGVSQKAIRATRAMIDFAYLARYQSHSDETLIYLEAALEDFHSDKGIFIDPRSRTKEDFNFPKLHALAHYTEAIKKFGATDNYNTEFTERLHIDIAKDAFENSNKKGDFIKQMVLYLLRHEKINFLETQLKWRSGELENEVRPGLFAGLSAYWLAKKPSKRALSFDSVVREHGAKLFAKSLFRFVRSYRRANNVAAYPINHENDLPFNQVSIWNSVKFPVPDIQGFDDVDHHVIVHAHPGESDGRFDTVLVEDEDRDEDDAFGIKGFRIAQLRVIFDIPESFKNNVFGCSPPSQLAYVEWFTKPVQKNSNSNLYEVSRSKTGGERDAAVIELKRIHRNCMLYPKFGRRVDPSWTSANVLEKCNQFFINNHVDSHTFQILY